MEPTEEDWNIISQLFDNDDELESASLGENEKIYTTYKLDGTTSMDISNDGEHSQNNNSAETESSNFSTDNVSINTPNSDSDMDIPLATLKRDYNKQSRRALFKQDNELESEEEHDDDVKDPTYKLGKNDSDSSDSEQEDKNVRRKKKKENKLKQQIRRNEKVTIKTRKLTKGNYVKQIGRNLKNPHARDTNWKRKATQLSRRKRVTPGRPPTARDKINKAIDRAMQESFNQHRIRQLVQQRHIQNLNVLLNSNGI